MKLSEVIDGVKDITAQFEIDFDELSDLKYKKIFERFVIPTISKHKPYTIYQRISITSSPYTFTSSEGIPDWISDFAPLDTLAVGGTLMSYGLHSPHSLEISDIAKPMFLWRYNNPDLYVHYTGEFNVLKVFKPVLEDDDNEDYDITYLKSNIEDVVIDLMASRVLVIIGRNRRLVKMPEIPFEFDGSELVREGLEMSIDTKQKITESNDWYLGVY